MKIFFAIIAVICLMGMIGDKEKENRKNFTMGFITTVAGIAALYVVGR